MYFRPYTTTICTEVTVHNSTDLHKTKTETTVENVQRLLFSFSTTYSPYEVLFTNKYNPFVKPENTVNETRQENHIIHQSISEIQIPVYLQTYRAD